MKRLAAFLLTLALLTGCAKFPENGNVGSTKRLAFTMTVQGQLRTGQEPGGTGLPYVYIIAINLSEDEVPTTTGPIPIVVPSGNGIVAGEATHFILWNPLASPQYQIYEFRDETLNEYFQTGVPLIYNPTNVGDRTLEFEVDLAQLVPESEVDNYQSVQVNFLTMNNTNQSGGGRIWDALGDANIPNEINSPFTARLNSPQIYTNANQSNIEPQGDAADPDLDIVNWSLEVRLQ